MLKKKRGFTLIELLVVIAIIAILSTLAVVALGNARQKARDSKRQSDLKVLQTAVEMYASDNGNVPAPVGGADLWDGIGYNSLQVLLASYLPGGLPEDPSSGTSARDWIYCNDGGSQYMVATSLEQKTPVSGDLDIISGWAVIECTASDAAVGNVPDCGDCANATCADGGIIDDDGAPAPGSVTAVCLGSDDT